MADQNRAATDDSHKTFEQLARELECDEDEQKFETTLRRLVKAPRPTEKGPSEEEPPAV